MVIRKGYYRTVRSSVNYAGYGIDSLYACLIAYIYDINMTAIEWIKPIHYFTLYMQGLNLITMYMLVQICSACNYCLSERETYMIINACMLVARL